MAISTDLRERVIRARENGEGSIRSLAIRFKIGTATLTRWLRLKRERGSVEPRPYGGGRRPKIEGEGLQLVARLVKAKPDSTNAELAKAYMEATGVEVSTMAMSRTLRRLGFTRKKRPSRPRKG